MKYRVVRIYPDVVYSFISRRYGTTQFCLGIPYGTGSTDDPAFCHEVLSYDLAVVNFIKLA